MAQIEQWLRAAMGEPLTRKALVSGLFYAPEWTRTTTDQAVHKALNRMRPVLMGPEASRSSSLRRFVDATDGSGGVDVLRAFSRTVAKGKLKRLLVPSLDGTAQLLVLGIVELELLAS